LSLSDTLGLKHTVATFRKGVRAVQMVGRASMYSARLLGHSYTHIHTHLPMFTHILQVMHSCRYKKDAWRM